MKTKKKGLIAGLIILFLIIAFFGTIVTFATDYLWFKELGYTSVFFKKLFTQLTLGIPTFIVIMALTYVYLRVLKRDYYHKIHTVEETSVSEKTVNRISLGLGAGFSIIVTIATTTRLWFEILNFMNSTDFNIKDPIFNMDVSFYVFKLAFINQMTQILIGIIVAFAALTLIYYFLLLSLRRPKIFETVEEDSQYSSFGQEAEQEQQQSPFGNIFGQMFGQQAGQAFSGAFGGQQKQGQQKPKKQPAKGNFTELMSIAGRQISILGVIFFLMVGVTFFMKQFELLYSRSGILYGAGYTDINVTLWQYRVVMVLAVISAITLVAGLKKRSYKLALAVPVVMIVISVAGSGAAGLVQNLIVSPDEINKESEYLQNNITFTQNAYGLKDISVKDFTATNDLTKQDIADNMDTINNIRINDFEPAKKFYNQTQSIRTYYQFNDVDVDRYMIDGKYTQTFLSAREIDGSKISDQWLTRHLKYTHGYGITLSRVDKVTASGQPDMLIDSIPPVSDVPEIQITRPEIYFGEKEDDYIITNTDEQEFDYPSGESNTYTTYEGNAGIKLNMLNKILFTIREQSIKIFASTNIDSDSKIIINRNIKQRVQKIAPFLHYDQDPYIVTVDGKLYWMMDAYTYSTSYPYSEPYSKESPVNYIRNSVKVVVDAYNGDTNFYLVNDEDPVANTLAKIYPELFKDIDTMPESLKAHIRYPQFMFGIQASVYKRYHMNDVKVFYQSEDVWDIATEIFGTKETEMSPTYYVMKLPGEDKVEFINSVPYTPHNKKNMTGLLVARNDGENYGELILYRLPKDKITYGPMQIESQIDQDTTISKEFSLWSSAGSTYTRGNMFVIPIKNSLVYVEPVYLEAANESSLPEVKRVIVAYGDRIAYEPTLAGALEKLFGDGATGGQATGQAPGGTGGGTGTEPGTMTVEELAQQASDAYNNAIQAQQNGDWAAYGNYLQELKSYLDLMAPQAPPEAPTDTI